MIDLRYVKKLLEMIDASSVNTIEITSEKGIRIRVSKNSRQAVQLVGVPARRAGQGTGLAPAHAGAVECADANRLDELGAHEQPVERGAAQAGIHHDRRSPGAFALEVEPVTADIDEPAAGWKGR